LKILKSLKLLFIQIFESIPKVHHQKSFDVLINQNNQSFNSKEIIVIFNKLLNIIVRTVFKITCVISKTKKQIFDLLYRDYNKYYFN